MSFTIGKKLTAGFGLMAGILAIVAIINYFNLHELHELQEEVGARADDAVTIQEGVGMADKLYAMMIGTMVTGDIGGTKSEWRNLKREMEADFKKATGLVDTDAERALVKEAEAHARQMVEVYERTILPLLTEENTPDNGLRLQEAHQKLIDNMKIMEDSYQQIAGSLEDELHEADKHFDDTYTATIQLVTIFSAVGLIVAIIVGVAITRGISGPITRIVKAAEGIAKGNINQEVTVTSDDEIGQLAATFRTLVETQKQKSRTAEQIAIGNLAVDVDILSEADILGRSMNVMKQAITALAEDAAKLAAAALDGRLDIRADASRHNGDFAKIIKGMNQTVDTLVGHLDAMPAPAMIIDKDYNIQYMNKMGASILGRSQSQLIGSKCYDQFKTSDCNTDRCACGQAMRNGTRATSETDAHPLGTNLEIQYTGVPVRDLEGNIIGAFEVVSDQTAIKQAARTSEKQARFQADEVRKLVINLEKVASGNLNISTEVGAVDEDTQDIGKNFEAINTGLRGTIDAIRRLADDALMLAGAAEQGKLTTRAESSKHQGDYLKIVRGINNTLDAVVAPINEAASVMDQLANYNLRARVAGDYKGDHARIKDSLNATAIALHDAIVQVAEVTDQVSSASTQIASSSQQVAEGASEQASSLEETSSSLEEMSSMTKQNADNTQQAKSLAETTRSAANQGSDAMSSMVASMGKIKSAAEGTAAIIKDINEIAFQTNLLALNAAVEAARAGDAGRGFAVVAEEVRNLAGRAKEAAQKTEVLIKESVSLAEEGGEISDQVNATLTEIVSSVSKVTDIVGEIAVASQEQARGIEQVNRAVTEMDKVVQQSAANSEESSSAAEELASQAEELAAMVGRFEVNRSASASVRTVNPSGSRSSAAKRRKGSAEREKGRQAPTPVSSYSPDALIPFDDDPDFAEF